MSRRQLHTLGGLASLGAVERRPVPSYDGPSQPMGDRAGFALVRPPIPVDPYPSRGGHPGGRGGRAEPSLTTRGDSPIDPARCRGAGWVERTFRFPLIPAPLVPGAETNPGTQIRVSSVRCSHMRMVAMHGALTWTSSANPIDSYPLDLANLSMRLTLNGEQDLTTTGEAAAFVSFAEMFGLSGANWFWFSAPPRLLVGDTIQLNLRNEYGLGNPGNSNLSGNVTLRMVDSDWWEAFYLNAGDESACDR